MMESGKPGENAAKTVVVALLGDELDSIVADVEQGRREHILKTLDERGAAQSLIREQYTGRYPFELLQNANDAIGARRDLDSECLSHVRFVVTSEALIVADTGIGFGPEEIRAICGFGRSSKDPRKSIGYKGLGFKAVGEISHSPQVVAGGLRFGFDDRRAREEVRRRVGDLPRGQRLPVYAFPFLLDGPDFGGDGRLVESILAEGFRTVLRFPYRAGVAPSKVVEDLERLVVPRLLLFLDSVDRLEVVGTTRDFEAQAVREGNGAPSRVLIEVGETLEDWSVFRRWHPIEDRSLLDGLGTAWEEVEEITVAAAVRYDSAGRLDLGHAEPLHVYFPTEEHTGVGVLLHADFPLELDRRHVSRAPETSAYRAWLVGRLADLVADEVAPFLARGENPSGAVRALAERRARSDFGSVIWEAVLERLRSSSFIPTVDGSVRRPGEVVVRPDAMVTTGDVDRFMVRSRITNCVVQEIDADGPARALLVDVLDVRVGTDTDFLHAFRIPPETPEGFYTWLVRWSGHRHQHYAAQALRDIACVRVTSGEWVTPRSGPFFPRERDAPELPVDVPIRVAHLPPVEGLASLLEAAGVRRFRWREIIGDHALPRLESEDSSEAERDSAFQLLRAYHASSENRGDEEILVRLGRVLVPARNLDGTARTLVSAEHVYFPEVWTGDGLAERVYGPFASVEFFDVEPPDDEMEKSQDLRFYGWLGVAERPRIEEAVAGDARYQWRRSELSRVRQHPHRRYKDWWLRWAQDEKVNLAAKCPQGHPETQSLLRSWALDRIGDLVESGTQAQLVALYLAIVQNWESTYRKARRAEFRCWHSQHNGDRVRSAPSLLRFILEHSEWIPTVLNGQVTLSRPADAWRAHRDIPRYLRTYLRFLPEELDRLVFAGAAAELGIVDGARPGLGDLTALLTKLAQSAVNDGNVSDDVRRAARWAMRRLDETLATHKGHEELAVPLLAVRDGVWFFTEEPVVADDPILRTTWQDAYPILDADRDLSRLQRAANLTRLDELVEISPRALGPTVSQEGVADAFRASLPYLVATVSHDAESRLDQVIPRLARFECVSCDQLVLDQRLDGETRTQEGARCYIASRRVREGSTFRMLGTGYFEVDSDGGVDWYSFGPQLASFLGVPRFGDAFSIILHGDERDRAAYLDSRGITRAELEEAHTLLEQRDELEFEGVFAPLLGDGQIDLSVEMNRSEQRKTDHADDSAPAGDLDGARARPLESLPPIDFDAVEFTEVEPGNPTERLVHSFRPRRSDSVPKGADSTDWAKHHQVAQEHGRRGEEAVYEKERRRLTSRGQDPDNVHWESHRNELAPYDLRSLEEDGQVIYLEVKATSSSDPASPFEISSAELDFAIEHRDRYCIYRVTEVDTATPRIFRIVDPIGWLLSGRGTITVRSARISFSLGAAGGSISDT